MKYKIDEMISINNKEWRIAEYRMGRGREWIYTLAHEYNHLLHFNVDPCEGLGNLPGCSDEYNYADVLTKLYGA